MPRGGHFGKPAVYKPPYEVSPDRNQRADSAPIVLDHKELMVKMREAKDADNLDEYHRYRDMLNDLERSGRQPHSKANHNRSSDAAPNIDELDLEEVDCIDTSEDREDHLNPHAHQSASRPDKHSKATKKSHQSQKHDHYRRSDSPHTTPKSSNSHSNKATDRLDQETTTSEKTHNHQEKANDQPAESSLSNGHHNHTEHDQEEGSEDDEDEEAAFFQFADDVDLDLMVRAADRQLEDSPANSADDTNCCTEQELDLKETEPGDEEDDEDEEVSEVAIDLRDANEAEIEPPRKAVEQEPARPPTHEKLECIPEVVKTPEPILEAAVQSSKSVPLVEVLATLFETDNKHEEKPAIEARKAASDASAPEPIKRRIISLVKPPSITQNNSQNGAPVRKIISLRPSTSSNLVNDPLKRLNNPDAKEEKTKPKPKVPPKPIQMHASKKPYHNMKRQKNKFRK